MSAYSDLLAELGYTPGDRAYDLFLAALQSGFGKTAHEKPITLHDSSGFVAGYDAADLADAVAAAGAKAGYTAESKIVKWSAAFSTGTWSSTPATYLITLTIDKGMGFKIPIVVTYTTGIGAFSKVTQLSRLINEACSRYGLMCGLTATGLEMAAVDCVGFTVAMNEALAALASSIVVTTDDIMDMTARATGINATVSANESVITTSADCTGIIRVGDRISFPNNAATTEWVTVVSVSSDGGDVMVDRPCGATTAKAITAHTPLVMERPVLELGPGTYTGAIELCGNIHVKGHNAATFAGTSWTIQPGHQAHWDGVRFKPATNMRSTYRVDYVDGKVSLPDKPKEVFGPEMALSEAAMVGLVANSTNGQRLASIAYWPLDRAATPAIAPAAYCATNGIPITTYVRQQGWDVDTSAFNAKAFVPHLRRATRNNGWEVAAQQYVYGTPSAFADVLGMIREVLCPQDHIEQLRDSATTDAALKAEMTVTSEQSTDYGVYRHLGLKCRGFIPPQRRGVADMDTLSSQESCSGFYGKLIREAYLWSFSPLQNETALRAGEMHPHGMAVTDLTANYKMGWIIGGIAPASWVVAGGGATSTVVISGDYSGSPADGRPYVAEGDYVGNDYHGWLEVTAVDYSSPNTTITVTGAWQTTFTGAGASVTSFQLWNRTRLHEHLERISAKRTKTLMYAPFPLTYLVGQCFKAFVDRLSVLSLAGTLKPVTVTTLVNAQFPAADNLAASLLPDWDIDNWDAADPITLATGSTYDYRQGIYLSSAPHFAVVSIETAPESGVFQKWMHMDDQSSAYWRRGVWVKPGRTYRFRFVAKDAAGVGAFQVHVGIGVPLHRGDYSETVSKWHCPVVAKTSAAGAANFDVVVGANGQQTMPEYAVNGLIKLEFHVWRVDGATEVRNLVLEYA